MNLLKLLEFNKFWYKINLESGAQNTWYYDLGYGNKYLLNESQFLEFLPLSGNVVSNSFLAKDLRSSFLTNSKNYNKSKNFKTRSFTFKKQESSLKSFTQNLCGLKKLFLVKSLKQLSIFVNPPKVLHKGFHYYLEPNSTFGRTLFVHGGNRRLKKLKKVSNNLKLKSQEKGNLNLLFGTDKSLIKILKIRVKFRRKPLNFWKKDQKPFSRMIKISKIGSVKEPLKQIFSRNLSKLDLNSVVNKKRDNLFNSNLFALKTKKLIKSL